MLQRGTRIRMALCRHAWSHPRHELSADLLPVMVSECLHQCGAVRKLPLDAPRLVRVYPTADASKVRLRAWPMLRRRA